MTTIKTVRFVCDNSRFCSSQVESGHGLPLGWFAVTHALSDSAKEHRHFCSVQCVKQGVGWHQEQSISEGLERLSEVAGGYFEDTDADEYVEAVRKGG